MPCKDNGFKKSSIKQLQTAGKKKFFEAFEEYVDAKIDKALYPTMMPAKSKRLEKATERLMVMLDAISIQLEM